jgi:hypothetical protein
MATTLSNTGKSLDPSHFRLIRAELYNHAGDVKIINELISNITIRESIFLPSLIVEMTISDPINFFESFALIGQETLTLEFEKFPISADLPVARRMDFIITEYSNYAKSESNANQQAYTLKGISDYAYNSKFLEISRAYKGSAIENMVRIVSDDLFYNQILVRGSDTSSHKGIITLQEPLKAIEYFRKIARDENGAPFYFYQSIDNIVRIFSLTYLMDTEENKVYNTYMYLKGYVSPAGTVEDYKERAARILEVSSQLGLSKITQSTKGAYASENNFLDLSNKIYRKKIFDYGGDSGKNVRENAIADKGHTLLSNSFQIGRNFSRKLSSLPGAHKENISTSSLAFGATQSNYNDDLQDGVATLNAFSAKLNTMTQNIELNGDFNLQSGRKIRLLFPKSMEAIAYKGFNKDDYETQHVDTLLSGEYLITSVMHKFNFSEQEDKYTCSLVVKKDSVFTEI